MGSLAPHWTALDLDPAKADPGDVRSAFIRFAKYVHPDHGGTDHSFNALREARDAALAELLAMPCHWCSQGKVTIGSGLAAVKLQCSACGGTGLKHRSEKK